MASHNEGELKFGEEKLEKRSARVLPGTSTSERGAFMRVFATAGEYLRICDEDAVRKVATAQPTSASSSQGPDWSQIDWSQQERVARSRLTAERLGVTPAVPPPPLRPSATRDALRESLTAQINRERRARGTAIYSVGCLNRWGAAEARQRGLPIVRQAPALPPSLDAASRPLSARPLSSQWEMAATYQMGARALQRPADMPVPPPPASGSSAASDVPMDTFPAAASAGPSSEASGTEGATWHGPLRRSVKVVSTAAELEKSRAAASRSSHELNRQRAPFQSPPVAASATHPTTASSQPISPRRSRLPACIRSTVAEKQMLLEAELEASQQEREELEALEAARKMEAGAEEAEEALETVLNQAGGVVEALDEVDGAMEAEAMVAEAIEAEADSEEVTMEEEASAELAGADHDATEMIYHEARPSEAAQEARAALEVRVVAEAPTAQAAKAEEQAVPDCEPSAIEADAPPPPSSVKFRRKGPDGTQLDSTPRPTPPSRAPRALAPSPLLCGIRATVAAAAAAGAAAAPRALSFGPDGTPIDPETVAEEEAMEEEAETVPRAPEAAAASADAAKAARAVAVALRAAAATRDAAQKKAAEAAAAAAAAEAAEATAARVVAAAAAAVRAVGRAETGALGGQRHAAADEVLRVVEAARARLQAEAEAEAKAEAKAREESKVQAEAAEAEAEAAAAEAMAAAAAAEEAAAMEAVESADATAYEADETATEPPFASAPFPLTSPLGIVQAHPAQAAAMPHAHAITAAVPPAPPSFAAAPAYALTLERSQGCPPHCLRRHPMHLPQRIELPSVAGEVLTLGRADECDVQLDSLLYPTMISRKHARLVAAETEGTWIVDDCGAANGTHVNGHSVGGASKDGNTQVAKRARVLQVGDVLCLGTMRGRTSSDAVYRVTTL
jgi:hypothetical protein